MKRYYNPTTHEWYTEGTPLTKNIPNGVFSGIPSEERLESWGFEEYIEPTPTPEELLARAKASKIAELEAYDASEEVNSFSVDGKTMWLDAATRQQLRISLDAMQQLGLVEVYASDALNVTEAHKAAINAKTTVKQVEDYNFQSGYPEKLAF